MIKNSLLCVLLLAFITVNATDTLRVGYYKTPPFVNIDSKNKLEGISIWLWEEVSNDLNISYETSELSLDNLLDSIRNGSIDMFIVPLTITSERNKFIQFTAPFYVASSALMIHEESTLTKALTFIASFFSLAFLKALGALFCVILVFGFLVWLFERKHNKQQFGGKTAGIWSGIWWSAVTMTTVGYGDKSPTTTGGRIVALIWMFVAITIISGYTASITSSLTVSNMNWNKSDINQFKETPIATVSESATEAWLKGHFFSDIHAYSNLELCINALDSGIVDGVAYDEPAIAAYLETNTDNDYQLINSPYNLQLYAFGFAEHIDDSVVNKISTQMLEITESVEWQILLTEYDLKQD